MTNVSTRFDFHDGVVRVFHNSGFFSNCSVSLHAIVTYFNQHRQLPRAVELGRSFKYFKDDLKDHIDAYPLYFRPNPSIEIRYVAPIDFPLFSLFDYADQDYQAIYPFISRYFTPTAQIHEITGDLCRRYDLNLERTLAVCYRGTDKWKDTGLGSYEEYIDMIMRILDLEPGLTVLVQTDQTQFIDACKKELGNCVWFKELPTTESDTAIHDLVTEQKTNWTQTFVSATLLLSQCRHLVLHTGNVARWICLYRGHTSRVYQYIKPKEDGAVGKWLR